MGDGTIFVVCINLLGQTMKRRENLFPEIFPTEKRRNAILRDTLASGLESYVTISDTRQIFFDASSITTVIRLNPCANVWVENNHRVLVPQHHSYHQISASPIKLHNHASPATNKICTPTPLPNTPSNLLRLPTSPRTPPHSTSPKPHHRPHPRPTPHP